jgi:hypothetical protein
MLGLDSPDQLLICELRAHAATMYEERSVPPWYQLHVPWAYDLSFRIRFSVGAQGRLRLLPCWQERRHGGNGRYTNSVPNQVKG